MSNLDIELGIKTTNGAIAPAILEGITWITERRGTPGKLTFKCLFDENNSFEEGDLVTVKYKGQKVFYGFIFAISRDKDKILSVTAYDQLRYLKNKDVPYQELKKIDNRILPRIYYIFDGDEEIILVEEYICGITLNELIEQKK